MRILVVNAGSSSVQLQLVEAPSAPADADRCTVRFDGKVENLKQSPVMRIGEEQRPTDAHDHSSALQALLDAGGAELDVDRLDAAVHRVVHGGAQHAKAAIVDDAVLSGIDKLDELAPLHNRAAAQGIRTLRRRAPKLTQIAVFDTAFHSGLPELSRSYAIDPELAQRHGIRRYGFHGTAVRYMLEHWVRQTGAALDGSRVIAVHLGGGASVTALAGGQSVATSMGMTPLQGLVMGTRSGDIDPAVLGVLASREGWTLPQVLTVLNQKSGLRALSGTTEDTRVLVKAMEHDPRARLALELFCRRIVEYVGAYLAVLGGADALLLGGVINENTAWVRAEICRRFEWYGLHLDPSLNERTLDRFGGISTAASTFPAWVVPAREDLQLAFEAIQLLESDRPRVSVEARRP